MALISLLCLGLVARVYTRHGKQGVVIAHDVFARKGPSYHYDTAFVEPLHSGLECHRLDSRDDWCQIALGQDSRPDPLSSR